MSSKILSSLTDDNRNLRKQIHRILQIFDRRISSSSSSSSRLRSPHQTTPDPLEQNNLLPRSPDLRDVVKDSMRRESAAAAAAATRSIKRHVDSPRPLRRRPTDEDGDHRETTVAAPERRFSCDGREPKKKSSSATRLNELPPRLSLDSRTGSIKLSSSDVLDRFHVECENRGSAEPRNRGRSSGIVAKLMGLECFPEPDHNRTGNYISNPNEIPNLQKRPRSPASPSPKLDSSSTHLSPTSSVYGAIEKRIAEIEFKKSGRDLRALKQILEAMQRTRDRIENQTERDVSAAPRRRRRKVSEENGVYDPKSSNSPPKANDGASLRVLNNVHRLRSSSTKSSKETITTTTPSPPPPRRKAAIEPRRDMERDRTVKNAARGSKLKSKTPRSIDAQMNEVSGDGETPKVEAENRVEQHQQRCLKTRREPTEEISIEQPSPVSVLDAAFYGEDPPSPVRKIALAFRDDEDPISDETERGRSDLALETEPNRKYERKIIPDVENEPLLVRGDTSGGLCTRKRATGELNAMMTAVENSNADDEGGDGVLKVLVSDMKNESEDWTRCKSEVPSLVLDIERLIYKDLVTSACIVICNEVSMKH